MLGSFDGVDLVKRMEIYIQAAEELFVAVGLVEECDYVSALWDECEKALFEVFDGDLFGGAVEKLFERFAAVAGVADCELVRFDGVDRERYLALEGPSIEYG